MSGDTVWARVGRDPGRWRPLSFPWYAWVDDNVFVGATERSVLRQVRASERRRLRAQRDTSRAVPARPVKVEL